MTTRETIERYFDRLTRREPWDALLTDDMVFTSFASPNRQVTGREAYLQATRRFYSMIDTVQVRDSIIDGDRACVLTRYELRPPNGPPSFVSDVAEILTIRDGRIAALSIYFDSAPFPR